MNRMMMSELQPELHKWPFLRMRRENMAKNCPKCCQIAKICTGSRDIVVAEKEHGKRFTATFRAGVILRTRRELHGLLHRAIHCFVR